MAASHISGDTFREMCDHIFWSNARPAESPGFRHGDVVFCKIDEVWRVLRAARRRRNRIVLVTGEGDRPVTPALWTHKPPQVATWFGTNQFVKHPEARAIPLGLGNAGDPKALSSNDLLSLPAEPVERTGLLYANFSAHSNPGVRGPLLEWLRSPAQAWITREAYGSTGGKPAYLEQLRRHHFVLCPPGNGEDTHRMWEALHAGAIPVIRRSPAMEAFSELPVLVMDDLRDITAGHLQSSLPGMRARNLKLLEVDHWRALFNEAREQARRLPRITPFEWIGAWLKEAVVIASRRGL